MGTIPDPVALFLTRLSFRTRMFFVISGAVLIHLSLGTYHTFGNMLPYMTSYLRIVRNQTVNHEQLIWIPTFQGSFPFAMVIGGSLSLRFGPRLTTSIGCLIMLYFTLYRFDFFGNFRIGVYLSSMTINQSYLAFLFSYGIMFGLGQGISYVVAVSCVINWSPPQMVGLGSGIVAAGFGVSSMIFAPIQTRLINPDNISPTHDGFFHDFALLSRVPGVFVTLAIIYLVMQTVGLVFICDPPLEFARRMHLDFGGDTALIDMAWLSKRRSQLLNDWRKGISNTFQRYNYARLIQNENLNEEPSLEVCENQTFEGLTSEVQTRRNFIDEDFSDGSESELELVGRHQGHSLAPSEVLRSSTFWFLFAALFCCSFYGNMFYNLYKTFGETFIEDDFFLAMALSVGSLANAVARISWGLLTDKTSFQFSLTIATCFATLLLLTMPLTAEFGKWIYLIWLVGMFIAMGATHALFITAVVRCFGTRHKVVNYGCLILSTTISGILLTVGSEFFLEQIGYNWAFIITSFFPFIGIFYFYFSYTYLTTSNIEKKYFNVD